MRFVRKIRVFFSDPKVWSVIIIIELLLLIFVIWQDNRMVDECMILVDDLQRDLHEANERLSQVQVSKLQEEKKVVPVPVMIVFEKRGEGVWSVKTDPLNGTITGYIIAYNNSGAVVGFFVYRDYDFIKLPEGTVYLGFFGDSGFSSTYRVIYKSGIEDPSWFRVDNKNAAAFLFVGR